MRLPNTNQVPLDYEDLSAGRAAIALIRYPAKVDRSSNRYKGPVLFNPGVCHGISDSMQPSDVHLQEDLVAQG